MCSFRSVLILAAAVLPSVSAQSLCQTGWTQAPNSSEAWSSKCYRNIGPTIGRGTVMWPKFGFNHSNCKAECKNASATARLLCSASEAENNFVSKQAYMRGWVAFTQDDSRPDYEEPAGGWGWECGSTYVPPWSPAELGNQGDPDDRGDNGADVSCAMLRRDGTVEDRSCQEGDVTSFWSNSALLGPFLTALRPCADCPLTAAQWPASARTTRRHQPPPPAWTGASRLTASCARGSAYSEESLAQTWWDRPTAMAASPGPSFAK